MKDSLGDRMKGNYESRTQMKLPRRTYVIIRLDGKAFHTYTRGLDKPFDNELITDMASTTKFLCDTIQGCKMGYTQSDEISLLLTDFDRLTTDAWFDNNIQKMVSVSASMATGFFNRIRENDEFDEPRPLAFFDSRVFTIPTAVEVENYFVWRQKDATRNSIQMVAQHHFSHKELHGKTTEDLLEMLEMVGDPWEKYFPEQRYGTWIKKDNRADHSGFYMVSATDFVEHRELLTEQVPRLDDMED